MTSATAVNPPRAVRAFGARLGDASRPMGLLQRRKLVSLLTQTKGPLSLHCTVRQVQGYPESWCGDLDGTEQLVALASSEDRREPETVQISLGSWIGRRGHRSAVVDGDRPRIHLIADAVAAVAGTQSLRANYGRTRWSRRGLRGLPVRVTVWAVPRPLDRRCRVEERIPFGRFGPLKSQPSSAKRAMRMANSGVTFKAEIQRPVSC